MERGSTLKRATPQTLFLRAISHRQETYSKEGANQVGVEPTVLELLEPGKINERGDGYWKCKQRSVYPVWLM